MLENKNQNPKIEEVNNYLRKHKIQELFEDLCSAISYKKPDDIQKFLIEQLEKREKHGINIPLFNEDELKNIFNLFDLKQEGKIHRIKCKEALKSIANSTIKIEEIEEYDISNDVNFEEFKLLCDKLMGVS